MVVPAEAATTQDVTVTATGIICGTPSGLTLTYVNDNQVDIDWTVGVGSDSTMIRAAYGDYPTSITDGYLVYQGAGNHASDTGVSLADEVQGIYYRAWAAKAGVWTGTYASNWFGDNVMLIGDMLFLLGFLILPIGLTIIAFKAKIAWIMFPVSVLWLVLALGCNDLTTADYDTYYIIRIMSVMMAVASMFLIFAVQSLKRNPDDIMGSDRDDINIYGDGREIAELDASKQYNRDRIERMKSLRNRRRF
jgi:hypothetical protein